MTGYFSAYGLTIKSEVDLLLEPLKESASHDVVFCFNSCREPKSYQSWDAVWYEYSTKSLTIKFDDIGSYRISNGNRVTICPKKTATQDDIRQPILGTVMAAILQQRGCAVLHGSAVLIENDAVIIAGHKGQGKSTLAGWFHKSGNSLLSDDVCALEKTDNSFTIRSSFPKIRLYPDALIHLEKNPGDYPKVYRQDSKRMFSLESGFHNTTEPVKALIVLETGDELAIRQLQGMSAVKEILIHMIINRFPEQQPLELKAEVFNQATTISQFIRVYKLTRPKELSLLPATAKKIYATLRGYP